MSVIHTNNITNKDGTSGPTISGITTVSSSGFMMVPVGDTFKRNVVENVVKDGLVLYLDAGNGVSYPGSGTTWYDLSGESNNGTLLNGVGYNSDNGGSLVFDGVDDYIDLPSSFAFGTSTFSIECWVKADTLSGIDVIYYSQSSNASGFYGVGHNSNGNGFFLTDYNGSTRVTTNFGSNAVVDTWYHLVFLKNASNQYVVYRNTVASTTNNISTLSLTSADPRIGYNPVSAAEIWDGNISNFRIYNRALTAQEIQQNYNALKERYRL